jgi:hypothetical protein
MGEGKFSESGVNIPWMQIESGVNIIYTIQVIMFFAKQNIQ